MKNDDLFISITENGFSLIYQGSPLCNDKQSIDEIYLVCKMYKFELPKVAWNGICHEWVITSTIEA